MNGEVVEGGGSWDIAVLPATNQPSHNAHTCVTRTGERLPTPPAIAPPHTHPQQHTQTCVTSTGE